MTDDEMDDEEYERILGLSDEDLREEYERAKGLIDELNLDKEILQRDIEKYRQRLVRRDKQIRKMVDCLRAIAQDDDGHGGPCVCDHDAMAKESLKGYRKTLDPACVDDRILDRQAALSVRRIRAGGGEQ